MGRLIEQQAVIDCLTNTAKYYDMPQPDEWTKGLHFGLLHGLDNILDNVPTVEAILKADYNARLKADLVAMLVRLNNEIDDLRAYDDIETVDKCEEIIQEKINSLKGEVC